MKLLLSVTRPAFLLSDQGHVVLGGGKLAAGVAVTSVVTARASHHHSAPRLAGLQRFRYNVSRPMPSTRALLVALTLLHAACSVRAPSPDVEASACEACLARGKTWQGSAGCTTACAVQDTSCYRDHCPGPCSSSACGDCLAQAACERAGCTWEVAGEAMWCR